MGFSFAGVPPIRIRNPVYGLAVAAPASPATAHLWAETLDHARQTGFYGSVESWSLCGDRLFQALISHQTQQLKRVLKH